MRSHRLGEREQPEIFERRVPMRSDFAPVGLGVGDRAEGGEIAVFIDRRFVPAFAWRADEARQTGPENIRASGLPAARRRNAGL